MKKKSSQVRAMRQSSQDRFVAGHALTHLTSTVSKDGSTLPCSEVDEN
jgi:hypothetical protein